MISPVNCQVWVHFYLGRLRLEAQRKLQQLHLGGAETLGGEPHDDLVLLRGRHPRPRGQLTEVRHKRPKIVRVLRIKILCRLKVLSLHLTWDSKAAPLKRRESVPILLSGLQWQVSFSSEQMRLRWAQPGWPGGYKGLATRTRPCCVTSTTSLKFNK